jgi:hypothetical protein
MLKIEPGAKVVSSTCEHCGEPMTRITGFVYKDADAHAVYYASCYHHEGHEVWIDATFSPTWDEGLDDRVTFGCRVGAVEGQSEPAATLVSAAQAWDDRPVFGHKLSREDGLAHPSLPEFWALVDHVLVHDPLVHSHLYGPAATRRDQ